MSSFRNYALAAASAAAFSVIVPSALAQTRAGVAAKPVTVDSKVLNVAGTAKDPDAGDWLTYGKSLGETRYSPLKQIDASNAKRLGLAWTYVLGAGGGNQEGTPLVWNNTLYGITSWSVVYALDAKTGKELWRWDPEINESTTAPKICCGIVNRGLAIYNGKIFAPAIDGRLIALDALTGKPIWEARLAYNQDWYAVTMAPRVANGKVIIGVAGGDHPTRGFFDAYDAETGKRAWRFYTVPGDPSKPFENEAMRKASKTWNPEAYKMGGGGALWDGMAYDPESDLIYVGTGNAEPWVAKFRGDKAVDSLYTCSILAVKVSTGQLAWYYQEVPNDQWDFDAVQQIMLADMTINGKPRKVLMQAAKDGFFYVLDRITGEFISGTPWVQVNWAKGFDEKGRPMINPEAFYGKDPVTIYPTAGGAHNWSPMSFNPNTGLVYIPTTYATWTFAAGDTVVPLQTGHTGLAMGIAPPQPSKMPIIGPEPLGNERGILTAWDPINKKIAWRTPGGGGIGGGTVTTAGNLVFQTTNDGHFFAYTADKGEKVYETTFGRNGNAPPITYEVDGTQYVAFMGGTGRNQRVVGPTNAKIDFPPMLYVFTLDGKAQMPPAEPVGGGRGGAGRGPARGGPPATPPPAANPPHAENN